MVEEISNLVYSMSNASFIIRMEVGSRVPTEWFSWGRHDQGGRGKWQTCF